MNQQRLIQEATLEQAVTSLKNGLIAAYQKAVKAIQGGEAFDEAKALEVIKGLKASMAAPVEAAPVSPEQIAKVKAQVAALMAQAKTKIQDPQTLAMSIMSLGTMILGSQGPLRTAMGTGAYDSSVAAIAQSLTAAVELARAAKRSTTAKPAAGAPAAPAAAAAGKPAPAKTQGSFGSESANWGEWLHRMLNETGYEGPVGDSSRSYGRSRSRMQQPSTITPGGDEGEPWSAQGEIVGHAPRFDPGPHGPYNPSTSMLLNDPANPGEAIAGPLRDRVDAITQFAAKSGDADRAIQLMDETADWNSLPIEVLRLVAGYTPDEPHAHIKKLEQARIQGQHDLEQQLARAKQLAAEAKRMAEEEEPAPVTQYGTSMGTGGGQQYQVAAEQLQAQAMQLGELLSTYQQVDPSADEGQERHLLISEIRRGIVDAAFGTTDMQVRRMATSGAAGKPYGDVAGWRTRPGKTPVRDRDPDDVINPYQPGLTRFTGITDESLRGTKSFLELCEVQTLASLRAERMPFVQRRAAKPDYSQDYGFEWPEGGGPGSVLKDAAIKRAVGAGWTKLQPVLLQRIEAILSAAIKNVAKKGRKTLLVQDIPAELQAPELAATEWFITPAVLKEFLKRMELNVSPKFFEALNNAVAAAMDEVLESVRASGQPLVEWDPAGLTAIGAGLSAAALGFAGAPRLMGKIGRAAKGAVTGAIGGAKAGWADEPDDDEELEPEDAVSMDEPGEGENDPQGTQIDIGPDQADEIAELVNSGDVEDEGDPKAMSAFAVKLATIIGKHASLSAEVSAALEGDVIHMFSDLKGDFGRMLDAAFEDQGDRNADTGASDDDGDLVRGAVSAMNNWWDAGNGHGFQLYPPMYPSGEDLEPAPDGDYEEEPEGEEWSFPVGGEVDPGRPEVEETTTVA